MSIIRDFSEKVVLISGSSSGIGAQTAIEFARAGAQVVITGRNVERLSEVWKECTKVSPKGLIALKVLADVNSEDNCKRLIDTTVKAFGKLDVLVNNVGFGLFATIVDKNILQTYDQIMSTNVRSVVYLTHLSVEHLERSKGNVINISSNAGLKPFSRLIVYCMSKSAIDMLTKCLALELGPKGIRVNAVNPGVVKGTRNLKARGLNDEQINNYMKLIVSLVPLGRVGQPIDITNAILFLASDESSFVTGINYVTDGGYRYSTFNANK